MTSKANTENNIRYIIPMALYFFWIQCILWADRLITVATAGNGSISFNTSLFYFSHAAGCLLFARMITNSNDVLLTAQMKLMRASIVLSVLLTCLFTAGAAYLSGAILTAMICLTGFFSSPLIVTIQKHIQAEVSFKKRGLVLGKAFGSALLINFILFILFIPGSSGTSQTFTIEYAVSQIYLSLLIFLAAGIAVFLLTCAKQAPEDSGRTSAAASPISAKPRLIIMTIFICILFYSNIGIQDCVVSFSWFSGGNAMFFIRLFSIIGAFAAGFLCDRKGRHLPLLASYGLLAAGIAAGASWTMGFRNGPKPVYKRNYCKNSCWQNS